MKVGDIVSLKPSKHTKAQPGLFRVTAVWAPRWWERGETLDVVQLSGTGAWSGRAGGYAEDFLLVMTREEWVAENVMGNPV